MTEHYIDFNVNLDERDSEGKPKVAKIPNHDILILSNDITHVTISVIENGAETVLATHRIEPITEKFEKALLFQNKKVKQT